MTKKCKEFIFGNGGVISHFYQGCWVIMQIDPELGYIGQVKDKISTDDVLYYTGFNPHIKEELDILKWIESRLQNRIEGFILQVSTPNEDIVFNFANFKKESVESFLGRVRYIISLAEQEVRYD